MRATISKPVEEQIHQQNILLKAYDRAVLYLVAAFEHSQVLTSIESIAICQLTDNK